MPSKKQTGPGFDPSEFWKRKHWYISNAIKFRSGPILVTEGQYTSPQTHTSNGKPSKPSTWILIFTKLDDTNQPLSASQRIDNDTRLPTGIAISGEKWRDFKRAFGRYFMHKESRCQQEVNQFLMLSPTDYQDDKLFEDCDGAFVLKSPLRDPGLLERSKQRAGLIEKALSELPAYGMEHDDETPSRKTRTENKPLSSDTPQLGKHVPQNKEKNGKQVLEDEEENDEERDDEEDEDEEEDDDENEEEDQDLEGNPKTPDGLTDDTVTLFADSDFEDVDTPQKKTATTTTKVDDGWKVSMKKKPLSDKGKDTRKGKGKNALTPTSSGTKKLARRKGAEGASVSEDVEVITDTMMNDDGEPKTKKKKMSYASAVAGTISKPV